MPRLYRRRISKHNKAMIGRSLLSAAVCALILIALAGLSIALYNLFMVVVQEEERMRYFLAGMLGNALSLLALLAIVAIIKHCEDNR